MNGSVTTREIVFFGACIILSFFLLRGCDTPIDKSKYIPKQLFDASQDSLHISRNSLGQQESKTKLLYASVSELRKLNTSKDSSIQKLLKLVNKKTIGATVLSNTTSGTITSGTIITHKDTVKINGKDSLIYIYPQYTLKRDSGKWEDIFATANKDSFVVKYKVFNEFHITQDYEKQKVEGKWFKQDVPIIKVINLNPKTETRELKSFIGKPAKKKQGNAFIAGGIIAILLRETIKNVF